MKKSPNGRRIGKPPFEPGETPNLPARRTTMAVGRAPAA
jgi:hypothetical protein